MRVVVDRSLDEAVADEAEDHHPCEVPEDTDRGEGALVLAAHLAGLRVVQELLRDALVPLEERHADQDRAGDTDDLRPARQSSTPPVVFFGLFDPPLLLAPVRIFTAVTQSAAYATPLATPATRSKPLSLSWLP